MQLNMIDQVQNSRKWTFSLQDKLLIFAGCLLMGAYAVFFFSGRSIDQSQAVSETEPTISRPNLVPVKETPERVEDYWWQDDEEQYVLQINEQQVWLETICNRYSLARQLEYDQESDNWHEYWLKTASTNNFCDDEPSITWVEHLEAFKLSGNQLLIKTDRDQVLSFQPYLQSDL